MECLEVLHLVFGCLSGRDLAIVCCCCRFWREVGKSQHLWRPLCREKWPGCEAPDAQKVIQAMGGFRIFFMRRVLTMSQPPKQLQLRPWLRLEHLTVFVDLTYKGNSLISEVVTGNAIGQTLSFSLRIEPCVTTDAVLPREALTPFFYQGQLYYEKPFQAMHASEYWLNWSVVRSTDHKMACLLQSIPAPDGVLPWEQDGEDEGHEFCLPLLFQAELRGEVAFSSAFLRQPPLLTFACLDCRPVWGESLSDSMHFKLKELHLGIWKKDEKSAPPLERVLLTLQDLDWK